jgi:hypothetical protein
MRVVALALALAAAGCAGFTPVEPSQPVSEMPRNAPGLVSGPDGVFTIIGPAEEQPPPSGG